MSCWFHEGWMITKESEKLNRQVYDKFFKYTLEKKVETFKVCLLRRRVFLDSLRSICTFSASFSPVDIFETIPSARAALLCIVNLFVFIFHLSLLILRFRHNAEKCENDYELAFQRKKKHLNWLFMLAMHTSTKHEGTKRKPLIPLQLFHRRNSNGIWRLF